MSIIQQPHTEQAQPAQSANPSQQVPNQGGGRADSQQEYDWKAPINPAPAPAPNMNEILKNNGIHTIPGVTPGTCSTDRIEGQPALPRLQNGPRVCSI